jgi:hypothetical protein
MVILGQTVTLWADQIVNIPKRFKLIKEINSEVGIPERLSSAQDPDKSDKFIEQHMAYIKNLISKLNANGLEPESLEALKVILNQAFQGPLHSYLTIKYVDVAYKKKSFVVIDAKEFEKELGAQKKFWPKLLKRLKKTYPTEYLNRNGIEYETMAETTTCFEKNIFDIFAVKNKVDLQSDCPQCSPLSLLPFYGNINNTPRMKGNANLQLDNNVEFISIENYFSGKSACNDPYLDEILSFNDSLLDPIMNASKEKMPKNSVEGLKTQSQCFIGSYSLRSALESELSLIDSCKQNSQCTGLTHALAGQTVGDKVCGTLTGVWQTDRVGAITIPTKLEVQYFDKDGKKSFKSHFNDKLFLKILNSVKREKRNSSLEVKAHKPEPEPQAQ